MNVEHDYYSFSKRWAIRFDPNAQEEPYILVDLYNNEMFYISEQLYNILKFCLLGVFTIAQLINWSKKNLIDLSKEELMKIIQQLINFKIFIVSTNLDNECVKQKSNVYWKNYKLKDGLFLNVPQEAEIHLTNKCNLKCLHCGYNAGKGLPNELSINRWLDVFDDLEELGTTSIVISGGEPLLYPHIETILQHLSQKRMRVNILSNGYAINKNISKYLSNYNFRVQVSIDGSMAIHDKMRGIPCFNQIINNLALLQTNKNRFDIQMTITKYNLTEIKAVTKLALQLGAASINFGVLYEVGRAKENTAMLIDVHDLNRISLEIDALIKEFGNDIKIGYVNPLRLKYNITQPKESTLVYCPGGTSRLAIRSDGLVFPCQYGFCDEKFAAGSLQDESVRAIWFSQNWNLFRGVPVNKLHECSRCKAQQDCFLKICRLMAYSSAGNFYGSPPGCEWVRKSI